MKKTLLLIPLALLLPAAWFAVSLLPGPPYEPLDNAGLARMVESGALVIDIRRPEEWRQTGVVEGSHLITAFDARGRMLPDFPERFSAITDPEQPVVLICRTGNRTDALGRLLAEDAGYQQVFNVSRGIVSWIGGGGAVQDCTQPGPGIRC